jgi:integrase
LASKSSACLNYGRIYKRTYRSGRSSWTIDYHDENGKRIQKALHHVQSRKEAVFALSKKITEVFDRKYGVQQKRETIGFTAFSEIYLNDYAMTAKKSWKTDASMLKMMREFFKDIDLRTITPLMIERFRKSRLKAENKRSTVNRYTALLKRMFNIAIEENFAEENPVQKVKFYSERDNLCERILAEDEERRLMQTCSDTLRPILLVALNTGMRRG